ncbi:hypothetical protein HLH33_09960 [Gluconacetobacter diazotrophicus]|uniref:Uncharacterized protein n=1 Tax=Gluconacetobacter diazotrophicus TaxID=33996 RepID=A0A7W4FFJ9_GLUDI|nr:hypothetical protein [Gluconacetobacter diazotrophicus]MBB2156629.1 hypothetical protein [Gluconacetobacter diazotrophicus]
MINDLVRLARAPSGTLTLSERKPDSGTRCGCCAADHAVHLVADIPLCLTCVPAFALDEEGIDNIASIIWLPHVDQGVLSRLTAALHAVAAQEGHRVLDSNLTGWSAKASLSYKALVVRQTAAIAKMGSSRPSELRAAVLGLSEEQMDGRKGESGLRILINGTWFASHPDRYYSTLRSAFRKGGR